jgi:hypothetical protein
MQRTQEGSGILLRTKALEFDHLKQIVLRICEDDGNACESTALFRRAHNAAWDTLLTEFDKYDASERTRTPLLKVARIVHSSRPTMVAVSVRGQQW